MQQEIKERRTLSLSAFEANLVLKGLRGAETAPLCRGAKQEKEICL